MGLTSRLRTDKVLNSSYEENPIDYDLSIGYSGACALFANNIALFANNIAQHSAHPVHTVSGHLEPAFLHLRYTAAILVLSEYFRTFPSLVN